MYWNFERHFRAHVQSTSSSFQFSIRPAPFDNSRFLEHRFTLKRANNSSFIIHIIITLLWMKEYPDSLWWSIVRNAGRWCTIQVDGAQHSSICTVEMVHNIALTNPDRQAERGAYKPTVHIQKLVSFPLEQVFAYTWWAYMHHTHTSLLIYS